MTFAHLGLLGVGLAAVSIPIIIHLLFRQRRRPIEWAAMRFLLEALRKQRRKLRVQQILLLAVRCLVIACLALALGRPLLRAVGVLGGGGGRDVYIVIDDSLAASARRDGEEGSALAAHKRTALEILETLGAGDRAGLVTLGAPASGLVIPASSDVGSVRQLIEELQPTDSEADVAGAFEALGTRLGGDAEPEFAGRDVAVVLLSDFLRGTADLSRPLARSMEGVANLTVLAMRPREVGVPNVQIVGVEPLRSVVLTGAGERSEDLQVWVRLRRTGPAVGEAGVTTVRVAVSSMRDERVPAMVQEAVRWTPGQSEASVPLRVRTDRVASEASTGVLGAGASSALIVAEIDRDPVAGDNKMRRPVRVTDALDVGVIAQRRFGGGPRADRLAAPDWLRLALRPSASTPVEVVDIEPSAVDAPVLAALDAVFLATPDLLPLEAWDRLRRFVDAGGVLVVAPAEDANVQLWTDAFTGAFDLSWQIAREVTFHDADGLGLSKEIPPDTVLSFIERAEELGPLLEPVRVTRSLPVTGVGERDVVLRLSDDSAWMVATAPGAAAAGPNNGDSNRAGMSRGMVVYLGSAPVLTWTDLPARPFMVPLIQEMVTQGVGRSGASAMGVAGVPAFVGPSASRLEPIAEPGGMGAAGGAGRTARAVEDGLLVEPVRRAGIFRAMDETGRAIGVVAMNANVDAGRTEAQDPQAVSVWLGDALAEGQGGNGAAITWLDEGEPAAALAGERGGSPISLPLLVAALALAMVEVFLARWFSHAFREDSGEAAPGHAPGAMAS